MKIRYAKNHQENKQFFVLTVVAKDFISNWLWQIEKKPIWKIDVVVYSDESQVILGNAAFIFW